MRLVPIIAVATALAGASAAAPARAQEYPLGPPAGLRLAFTAPFFYTGFYATTHYPYAQQIHYQPQQGEMYRYTSRRHAKKRAYYVHHHRPPRQHYVTSYYGNGPYGYGPYNGYNW